MINVVPAFIASLPHCSGNVSKQVKTQEGFPLAHSLKVCFVMVENMVGNSVKVCFVMVGNMVGNSLKVCSVMVTRV